MILNEQLPNNQIIAKVGEKKKKHLLASMVARWGLLRGSGGAGEAVQLPGELKGELG